LGSPNIGLIGVLIEAKETVHIEAVPPYLDALKENAGFWTSDQLYRRVLRDEGGAVVTKRCKNLISGIADPIGIAMETPMRRAM
jgi:hypothetical protein